MYNSVPLELQFFLSCTVAGFVVAFLYDLIRVSRRIVNVNDFVINTEDILFFAVAAVILFYAAYLKNSGEIRWQWFIGGALGVFMYIFIVRNRFLNASLIIYSALVKVVGLVLKILAFPLKLILKIFKKPISIIVWHTGKGLRRVKGVAIYGKSKAGISLKNLRAVFLKK